MKRIIYFIPAVSYYALIFFISSRSYGIGIKTAFLDKGVHCLEFAILAFLLSFGFFKSLKSSLKDKALMTVFSGILLGFLDEFHQHFVPQRQFEVLDIIADGIGTLIGFVLYLYFYRRFNQ